MTRINNKDVREALHLIPSTDYILKNISLDRYNLPYNFIKVVIKEVVSQFKYDLINKNVSKINLESKIFQSIKIQLKRHSEPSIKNIINGTGIVLHTGLGRAPVSLNILKQAIKRIYPYCNLELSLEDGKRGDRVGNLKKLFSSLINAEDFLIVNNNASAVILMLNTLCEKKEVVVSRGQLVEIGGSFRIPDIINKSNSRLCEVGTTNKTHITDFEKSINKKTGAILYVHTSNYQVVGFTKKIEIKKLHKVSYDNSVPLLIDLGSGALADYSKENISPEKQINEYIKQGGDLICFSGDKLLGGPQSGIICGDKKLIQQLKNNPLYRALRVDKFKLVIIEEILRTYFSPKKIKKENIAFHMLNRNRKHLLKFANQIIQKIIYSKNKYNIKIKESYVEAGSGSLPNHKIESIAIMIKSKQYNAQKIADKFRAYRVPLIGYINNNIFHIDLKSIPEDQYFTLIKCLNVTLKS